MIPIREEIDKAYDTRVSGYSQARQILFEARFKHQNTTAIFPYAHKTLSPLRRDTPGAY